MLTEGVFAAVPTPFYPDERVYYRKLEANMARYSRSPLAGMLVLGSTGEAVMLDDAESREALRVAAEATAPEKVLLAGVSRESVRSTLAMAEAAAEYGYDAVLVRTPSYFSPQMSAIAVLNYFQSVADRSPLPVMLYNFPKLVRYEIPADLVGELANHPNISGIKDSSGNFEYLDAVLKATRTAPRRTVTVTPTFEAVTGRMLAAPAAEQEDTPGSLVSVVQLAGSSEDKTARKGSGAATAQSAAPLKTRTKEVGFQVLTGSAGNFLEALEAGASGSILAFAAFAPQACQEIYLAWKDHDLKLAAEKQARVSEACRHMYGFSPAAVKHASDFNGYYGGRVRSPLLRLLAAEKAEVEEALSGIRN
jgi:dihydrodipicolinate synthase/N-acetylneuraminate lyase